MQASPPPTPISPRVVSQYNRDGSLSGNGYGNGNNAGSNGKTMRSPLHELDEQEAPTPRMIPIPMRSLNSFSIHNRNDKTLLSPPPLAADHNIFFRDTFPDTDTDADRHDYTGDRVSTNSVDNIGISSSPIPFKTPRRSRTQDSKYWNSSSRGAKGINHHNNYQGTCNTNNNSNKQKNRGNFHEKGDGEGETEFVESECIPPVRRRAQSANLDLTPSSRSAYRQRHHRDQRPFPQCRSPFVKKGDSHLNRIRIQDYKGNRNNQDFGLGGYFGSDDVDIVACAAQAPERYNRRRAFSTGPALLLPLIGTTVLVGNFSESMSMDSFDSDSTISSMDDVNGSGNSGKNREKRICSSPAGDRMAMAMMEEGLVGGEVEEVIVASPLRKKSTRRTWMTPINPTTPGRCKDTISGTSPNPQLISPGNPSLEQNNLMPLSSSFLQLPDFFNVSRRRRSAMAMHSNVELVSALDCRNNCNSNGNNTNDSTNANSNPRTAFSRLVRLTTCITMGFILLTNSNPSDKSTATRNLQASTISKEKEDLGGSSMRTIKNFEGGWGLTLSDANVGSGLEPNRVVPNVPAVTLEQNKTKGRIRKKRRPRLAEANTLSSQRLSHMDAGLGVGNANLKAAPVPRRPKKFYMTEDEIRKKSTSFQNEVFRERHGPSSRKGYGAITNVMLLCFIGSLLFIIFTLAVGEVKRQFRFLRVIARCTPASQYEHMHRR